MEMHSIYSPDGAFQFLLLALFLTLAGAVAYLLLFTSAGLP